MLGPGMRVGKYEVKRLLGQGGFGMVYLGHDTGLDRECALKFLLPEHTARPEILQRFLEEARSAARIKHAGIVTVFECGVVEGAGPGLDGTAFIAMELLEGEALQARLARGPLALDHATEIARQVASALGAAHAAGIVHRDLKPDNIYLVPDPATALGERVKVLDFGIAKLTDAPAGTARTSTHAIFGTPRYMSPEQCKSTAKVDERSDIYALGCILFEMVTGKPPFEGDSGELIGRHQFVPPPLARALRPDLPGALDAAITAMLAKRPEDRPQTMADVMRLLGARASAIAAIAAAGPPAPTPIPPSVPLAPTPLAPGPFAPAGPAGPAPPEPPGVTAADSLHAVGPIVPVGQGGGGRPWWIYAAAGGVAILGLAIVALVASRTTQVIEHEARDAAVVEREDATPREDGPKQIVERLIDLRTRANALIAARTCDRLEAIRQEARAAGPLLGRELDRLACAVPRPGSQRPGPDATTTYAIPLEDSPSLGPADAKVTIVKFTEHACPYCNRTRETTTELRKKYGRDLREVHKHLIVHPQQATAAARAFCAAARQGKGWEMDRLLWEQGFARRRFDRTGAGHDCLSDPQGCPIVLGFARELGLELARFKADVRGACADRVRRDQDLAARFGVNATPVFFINGRFLSGAQPIGRFEEVIDEELQKANERIAQGTPRGRYYAEWVIARGEPRFDPPRPIHISSPDPLETASLLARSPAASANVRHVVIGWDFSSRDPRSRGRSKTDADTIVKGLYALAEAGRDLSGAVDVLSEALPYEGGLVQARAAREPWQKLAVRLRPGEAGLVRSRRGWHFVQRIEGPRPPPDVAAPPPDAQRTPAGVFYKVLARGPGGPKPGPTARVKVHYSGWTTDGTLFDSSLARGQPAVFPLNAVIPGWTDGVQLMSVGDRFRFWIPEDLAYKGRPGPPSGMLVFDVELLAIDP